MSSSCYQEIKEGKADVLLPVEVFYNPVQEFNRDLTVAVIRTFQGQHRNMWENARNQKLERLSRRNGAEESDKIPSEEYSGIVILEALAASGLRSMRFALEIPRVAKIIANDFDLTAAELIAKNAERNGEITKKLVTATHEDANLLMIQRRTGGDSFDVIDLDPYGSASKFLSAAMFSVSNGGLLCVTCTDAAVLCGSAFGTAMGRYGGTSLRCASSHEVGLRLLLHSLQLHAATYGRYVKPMISLSVDFYLRVFVRVFRGPGEAKMAPLRTAMVFVCSGCGSFHLQPLAHPDEKRKGVQHPGRGPPCGPSCEECGGHFNVAGPIWSDPIHDVDFIDSLLKNLQPNDDAAACKDGETGKEKDENYDWKLKTADRIIGMLSLAAEELQDCPLFYRPDHMTKKLHCHVPSAIQLRSAILNAGFRVSNSHVCPGSIKTDAPPKVLWDIMRCWVKHHKPLAERRLQETDSLALRILNKEVQLQANFDVHPEANPESRRLGLLRYQPNPEKDWGPKAKAKRASSPTEPLADKRARLQGRRTGEESEKKEESGGEMESVLDDVGKP